MIGTLTLRILGRLEARQIVHRDRVCSRYVHRVKKLIIMYVIPNLSYKLCVHIDIQVL